jgi:DNA oxidative demethylase
MTGRRLAQTAPLFDLLPGGPEGWKYIPDFLTTQEEAELLAHVGALEFSEVRMHGVAARRTTVHFGWSYVYDTRQLDRPEPIPDWVLDVRRRSAELVGIRAEDFEEVLVTCYPAGATIGWHRDAPTFGPTVVGVSLLTPCDMRFRRRVGDRFERYTQQLEPRSAYVLSGPARSIWQHSIPPVPALRYSITFRTVRAR